MRSLRGQRRGQSETGAGRRLHASRVSARTADDRAFGLSASLASGRGRVGGDEWAGKSERTAPYPREMRGHGHSAVCLSTQEEIPR
jgi:hypothetical protein